MYPAHPMSLLKFNKYDDALIGSVHMEGFGSGQIQMNLTFQGSRNFFIVNGVGSVRKEVNLDTGSLWIANPTSCVHCVSVQFDETLSLSLNFRTVFAVPVGIANQVQGAKYFASNQLAKARDYNVALRRRVQVNVAILELFRKNTVDSIASELKSVMDECRCTSLSCPACGPIGQFSGSACNDT